MFSCLQILEDYLSFVFFFSSSRRHTIYIGDWSSDVCSSDLSELCTARSCRTPFEVAHDAQRFPRGRGVSLTHRDTGRRRKTAATHPGAPSHTFSTAP